MFEISLKFRNLPNSRTVCSDETMHTMPLNPNPKPKPKATTTVSSKSSYAGFAMKPQANSQSSSAHYSSSAYSSVALASPAASVSGFAFCSSCF